METLELTKSKPYSASLKPHLNGEFLDYEILQKHRQEYFASGKKSQRIIREFTPEEQAAFDNGYTIDEIFDNLNKKYGLNI